MRGCVGRLEEQEMLKGWDGISVRVPLSVEVTAWTGICQGENQVWEVKEGPRAAGPRPQIQSRRTGVA